MRRSPILSSVRIFLAGAVVTITAALMFGIEDPLTTQYPLMWFVAALLFLLNSLPVLYEILYREDGPDPFSPILWLSLTFFFNIALSSMRRLNSNDFTLKAQNVPSGTPTEILLPVLVFAVISIICVLLGYYSKYGPRLAETAPSFNPGWSSQRAWIGVVFCGAIGLVGYYGLVGLIGTGPRTQLSRGSSAISFVAINFLSTAALVAVADTLVTLRRGGFDNILQNPMEWTKARFQPYRLALPKVALTVFVFVACVYFLWQLDGRGRAFTPIVAAGFLFHYVFWRLPYPLGTAFIFIRGFFATWAAAVAAAVLTLNPANIIATATDLSSGNETGYHVSNNLLIVIAGVPDMLDFQYGETFLSAFFEVLPISPFQETQFVYNSVFLPDAGRDFGVPISLMGELYLNFWIPGIIIGMLVVGLIMRFTYRWLITGVSRENVAGALLFAAITNNFLLTGNFSNSAPAMGLRVLPMIGVLLFVTGLPQQIRRWVTNTISDPSIAD
jgi:hypothetical protein